MKRLARSFLLGIIFFSFAWAQNSRSPYGGQEKRGIKSLSQEEIESYLEGRGMGLGKTAELNGYPGPMHVLELAENLQLTERQKGEVRKVFDQMHGEAVRLGGLIVDKERQLDRLFVSGKISPAMLLNTVVEIGRFQGELRAVHLRAHLETKQLLSGAQVKKYNELRGYGANKKSKKPRPHGPDGN